MGTLFPTDPSTSITILEMRHFSVVLVLNAQGCKPILGVTTHRWSRNTYAPHQVKDKGSPKPTVRQRGTLLRPSMYVDPQFSLLSSGS